MHATCGIKFNLIRKEKTKALNSYILRRCIAAYLCMKKGLQQKPNQVYQTNLNLTKPKYTIKYSGKNWKQLPYTCNLLNYHIVFGQTSKIPLTI